MKLEAQPETTVFHDRPSSFRPPLKGCIARDARLAAALEECYSDAFFSIAEQIYRSLVTADSDRMLSDLLNRMAEEELEQFRLLGELITALGGSGKPCGIGRMRKTGSCIERQETPHLLKACIDEKRQRIDRYETLMSHTADRVVRSVFSRLLSRERKQLTRLEGFQSS